MTRPFSPPLFHDAPGQSTETPHGEKLAFQGIEQAGIVSGQEQICCIHIYGRGMHNRKLKWVLNETT